MGSSLINLPDEVLWRICSFASAFDRLNRLNLLLICRRLLPIFTEAYYAEVGFNIFCLGSRVAPLTRSTYGTDTASSDGDGLVFDKRTLQKLGRLADHQRQLMRFVKRLELTRASFTTREDFFDSLSASQSVQQLELSLESLSASYVPCRAVSDFMHKLDTRRLSTLEISDMFVDSPACLARLVQQCPGLKRLKLSGRISFDRRPVSLGHDTARQSESDSEQDNSDHSDHDQSDLEEDERRFRIIHSLQLDSLDVEYNASYDHIEAFLSLLSLRLHHVTLKGRTEEDVKKMKQVVNRTVQYQTMMLNVYGAPIYNGALPHAPLHRVRIF